MDEVCRVVVIALDRAWEYVDARAHEDADGQSLVVTRNQIPIARFDRFNIKSWWHIEKL